MTDRNDITTWFRTSALAPTILVSVVYIIFLIGYFDRHQVGVERLHEGAGDIPYDGAYFYAIATQPLDVSEELDYPAYRYQRILFPIVARLVGIGNPSIISWSMMVIVLGSIILGTYLLAKLVRSWGKNPWYALIYGLFIGQFVAIRFVTGEPLCYFLVLVAAYFYVKDRISLAAIFFSMSILTKELAILFWLGFVIVAVFQRRKRDATLLSMAILPYVIWQIILRLWLGEFGFTGSETGIELIPFGGYIARGMEPEMALIPLLLIIPAILCIVLVIYLWRSGTVTPFTLALLFNALLVIQMPTEATGEIRAMARIAIGLVLAAILVGAELRISRVLNYGLFWIPLSAIYIPSLFLIP